MLTLTFLATLTGSTGASATLNGSQAIMNANVESWNLLWKDVISPNSELWQGLVGISQILAGFSLLYAILKDFQGILQDGGYNFQKLSEFAIPIFLVAILLLNNGAFTANLVTIARSLSYNQINLLYGKQILGIAMKDAVNTLQQTAQSNIDVKTLFADCINKVGDDLTKCINEKQSGLEAIKNKSPNSLSGSLATVLSTVINPAGTAVGTIGASILTGQNPVAALSNIFGSPFIAIAQTILLALQWGVQNAIELALLVTALLAPIAAALSLMPIAGRVFWGWASGFLGLMAFNLGYAILSGLMAITIFSMQNATVNTSALASIPELLSDLGFLLFTAVISPVIAGSIAGFGGIALFTGISNAASDALRGATSVVTSVVTVGVVKP